MKTAPFIITSFRPVCFRQRLHRRGGKVERRESAVLRWRPRPGRCL